MALVAAASPSLQCRAPLADRPPEGFFVGRRWTALLWGQGEAAGAGSGQRTAAVRARADTGSGAARALTPHAHSSRRPLLSWALVLLPSLKSAGRGISVCGAARGNEVGLSPPPPKSAGSGPRRGAFQRRQSGWCAQRPRPRFSPRCAGPQQASSCPALDEFARPSGPRPHLPKDRQLSPREDRSQDTYRKAGEGVLFLARDPARARRMCNISADPPRPPSQSIQLFQLSPFMPRVIVLT